MQGAPELKIGDLVKYRNKTMLSQIYRDWGHSRNFGYGVVIDTKEKSLCIHTVNEADVLQWFDIQEIEVINDIQ